MSLHLSRQGPYATMLFLVLLIIVFWTSSLGAQPVEIPAYTPFEQWVDAQINDNPIISELLLAILVFFTSILIARLTIRSVIFIERSYMPALIYLVVSTGYYVSPYTLRPMLAALMLTHAVKWILRSYSRKRVASGDYVVAGFWFSMAIIFFLPAIVALPMLFVGLVMFRFWDIREWIAVLAGIVFPFVVSLIIYSLMRVDLLLMFDGVFGKMGYDDGVFNFLASINALHWTFIGVILVLFLLSVANFFVRRKSFSSKPYLSYLYFIWFALVSVIVSVVLPVRTVYILPVIALPLAVLLPSYFNGRQPTFLSNFLYAMFIVTAIAISLLQLIIMSLQ